MSTMNRFLLLSKLILLTEAVMNARSNAPLCGRQTMTRHTLSMRVRSSGMDGRQSLPS